MGRAVLGLRAARGAGVFAWLRSSVPPSTPARVYDQRGSFLDDVQFWRPQPVYLVFKSSRPESLYFWLIIACVVGAAGIAVWGAFRHYVRPNTRRP